MHSAIRYNLPIVMHYPRWRHQPVIGKGDGKIQLPMVQAPGSRATNGKTMLPVVQAWVAEHAFGGLSGGESGSRLAELGFSSLPTWPILVTKYGGKMNYNYITRVLLAERRRLGLEKFDLHALRYRGVMELAWAGCDDDEIMAYSGRSTKAMVMKYAGAARQIMRAKTANQKRAIWMAL